MASLAVSIVLYRSDVAVLERALATLARAERFAGERGVLQKCRLMMVDHTPTPIASDLLQSWHDILSPWVELEYCFAGDNPGFGAGHNRVFAAIGADSDYFLVANPDIEFDTHSLAEGVDFLIRHEMVGLLAPALIDAGGSYRPGCFRHPDLLTLLLRSGGRGLVNKRSFRYECRDWQPGVTVFNPPLITGCCMLFRSKSFASLGGFDAGYFLYFEDFDLSLKAGALGMSAYFPQMRVKHGGGGAGKKGFLHIRYFVASALRYFRRNGLRIF